MNKARSRGMIWEPKEGGPPFKAIASYKHPATGERKRWWGPARQTKREANRDLTTFYGRVDQGVLVEATKQTVGAFLEEWLEVIKPGATDLRPSTWASYCSNLRKHVIPRIGGLQLQKLGPGDLVRLFDSLREAGRCNGGGGLSARTIEYDYTILNRALKAAVKWGRLARNPLEMIERPTAPKAKERKVWSPEQLGAFLGHVRQDRLYALWLLTCSTGMRRGELAGLTWSNLDLEAGRLSVIETRISINYKVAESQPKTIKGRRLVALDPATVAALRGWKAQQAKERLAWGPAWADSGLVFTKEDGNGYHPQSISDAFERHSRRAGLPRIALHDARHSYATAALRAGVNPKVVSSRLGHASVKITLDTYSHVLPEMDQEAADQVAGLILGS